MSRLPNPEREVCMHNRPVNWPCDVCDQIREPLEDRQKKEIDALKKQLEIARGALEKLSSHAHK